jgi:hypothetical protein
MKLDPVDYWKLRAAMADLERDQASLLAVQVRLAQSQARRQQVWQEVATNYELDATAQYQLSDAECSVTPANGNGQPPTA